MIMVKSVKTRYIAPLLSAVSLSLRGCIENDIPYPRIQQDILSLAVDGESAKAAIDRQKLTATVYLGEETDPADVSFSEYTYTEGAHSSVNLLEGSYDMTSPLKVTLSLYQDYTWTISAVQEIERYFTIEGQIGETVIDTAGRRVILSVPSTADMESLRVESVKLGPAGRTSMLPDINAGQKLDFSSPMHVAVSYFGRTEDWTIYVEETEAVVTTTQADAWVNVVWVYGAGPADADNGFQYRRAGTDEWTAVPQEFMGGTGGAFRAYIPHLLPLTEYEVRAVSGEHTGNTIAVTTGVAMPLPDASFDQWWLNGKVYCPWPDGGTSWWDTGNTGASTLGQSNVTPSDNTPGGVGMSAKLETRFVGIGAIGKLAAGSIYAGTFVKVDGTNGILDFGRPWEARPTKLRGYYNYSPALINYASSEFQHLLNRPDSCQIWLAVTDMAAPFQIRTNPKNRQLFDPDDPSVIAYGEMVRGASTEGWKEFEVKLEYRDTSRRPKYLLVVAAASKYGDYFTGGAGSVLYVDDFSLDYDY